MRSMLALAREPAARLDAERDRDRGEAEHVTDVTTAAFAFCKALVVILERPGCRTGG
jgi:hypothetical protein